MKPFTPAWKMFFFTAKPCFMNHVIKGGILALIVLCFYAVITLVGSAL